MRIGREGQAEAGSVNTPEVIAGLSWLFIAAPAAFLLATAWVVRLYPLTEAKHQAVRAELAAREGRA